MGLDCRHIQTEQVCYTDSVGDISTLFVHYEYAKDSTGLPYVVSVRYTNANGTVVDTTLGTVVPGACCCERIAIANGADIPDVTTGWVFPLSITNVRTFTISVVGSSNVTVNFAGSSVVLHAGQSRSWGGGDGKGLIDVSSITVDTGATSNADVIWEDV